jgi:hypothetical protein
MCECPASGFPGTERGREVYSGIPLLPVRGGGVHHFIGIEKYHSLIISEYYDVHRMSDSEET